MTGSHEVRGSIPLGSTNYFYHLGSPTGGPSSCVRQLEGHHQVALCGFCVPAWKPPIFGAGRSETIISAMNFDPSLAGDHSRRSLLVKPLTLRYRTVKAGAR